VSSNDLFCKKLAKIRTKRMKLTHYEQISELSDKITNYEKEVKDLIATADSAHGKNGGEAAEGDDNDDQGRRNDEEEGDDTDAGSDTSDDEFEDRFVELEEDLANVIADVHDMGTLSFLFLSLLVVRCATLPRQC